MCNKSIVYFYIVLLFLSLLTVKVQSQSAEDFITFDTLSVIFYNLENLFDDVDDTIRGDDEFTKNGLRAWTTFKYRSKINKLSQVILAANYWNIPSLIGVSEIENRNVIDALCLNSMLKRLGYKVVHKESKDHRGIDVALMYDPEIFFIIDSAFYEVGLDNGGYSRDILYAKLSCKTDTLHVFVCHWPSRYSGALSSESNRMKASNVLLEHCLRLFGENENSKILIMGDFNDEPSDKSLKNLIENTLISDQNYLINLMDNDFEMGSIKYRNQWFLFDQFVVSKNLLKSRKGIILEDKPEICFLPFTMIKDEKYLGLKPYRTFVGYKYIGGYSDHLPIRIKLIFR